MARSWAAAVRVAKRSCDVVQDPNCQRCCQPFSAEVKAHSVN
jgi:hypothetical protein